MQINSSRVEFRGQEYRLKPVAIKIVELGLNAFKPETRRGQFHQLLMLTVGEYAVEKREPYDSSTQQFRWVCD